MDLDFDPWKVKEIKPSDLILDKFESWERSANPRQKAWNRAIKWLSEIIQLPCEETASNKLRAIDKDNAFKFLTRAIFVDKSFDNFLRSCMIAPIKSQESTVQDDNSTPSGSDGLNTEQTPLHSAAKSGHLKKGKICKHTWKGNECKIQDCAFVHIDPCKDRECLALIGGLPIWRSRNCPLWHVRPKSDKPKTPKGNSTSLPKTARNGSSNAGPLKKQVLDRRNPKNYNGPTSLRSSYHRSPAPLHRAANVGHPKAMSHSTVAKGMAGNAKAAFANKPLNRGGSQNQNQNQRWGQKWNQHGNQNMVQQLEKKISEITNVFQELKRNI